jgi:hypothetical protein
MAKNRMINTKFWSDGWIINLDPLERYLYLYFLTNEHTNICGIYEIPIKQIALDTGIDRENLIRVLLPRFKESNKIYYINGWIYIKNFIKHQKASGNIKQGIENGLKEIPANIMAKIKLIDNTGGTQGGHSPISESESESEIESEIEIKSKSKETDIQKIVNYFFSLKGWDKNKSVVYSRYVKPAKELLEIAESVDKAKWALDRINNWAESQELDWSIETVFKRWFDLNKLPQEKNKKPRIDGNPAYKRDDVWYTILPSGEHKNLGSCGGTCRAFGAKCDKR